MLPAISIVRSFGWSFRIWSIDICDSGPLANANGVDAQTAVIASVIFILLSIEVTSSFLLNGGKKGRLYILPAYTFVVQIYTVPA